MATDTRIAITGLGYALGSDRRGNEDPVFDWLHTHDVNNKGLFTGYKERAVLAEGETLDGLMVEAAQNALGEAGVSVADVDVITGYGTVSEFITPNCLAKVHQQLGARDDCWLLPVQSEYTNYLAGLRLADAFIGNGMANHVLVVVGCNWTQHVDYHQAASISVGDGASAAVLGRTSDPSRFTLVDSQNYCETQWYGAMEVSPRVLAPPGDAIRLGANTNAVFNLHAGKGGEAFKQFGLLKPPELALNLLHKNGLKPEDVTVISHQASGVLLEKWCSAIKPKAYLDTMAEFGNMTLASIGVTLAHKYPEIETDYVVLLGIGIQQETSAILLKRD